MQTLAAYYQCHKRPVCFIQAVSSFRRNYPNATIVVSNDGGDDFSSFCASNMIQYTHYDAASSAETVNQLIYSDLQPILAYLRRLWSSFACIPESHIVLLEDDVRILRPHTVPFVHSINGNNPDWSLPPEMTAVLRARGYNGPVHLGGCGGCVLNKTYFMHIPFTAVESLLTSLPPLKTYASDVCLTFIALYYGGSVGSYSEFAETWYSDIIHRVNVEKSVAFLHQYKLYYDAVPSDADRAILGWSV